MMDDDEGSRRSVIPLYRVDDTTTFVPNSTTHGLMGDGVMGLWCFMMVDS